MHIGTLKFSYGIIICMKKILVFSFILLLGASCGPKKTANVEVAPPAATSTPQAIGEPSAPPAFVAAAGPNPDTKTKTPVTPTPAENGNTKIPAAPTDCAGNFECYETYYRAAVKDFGVAAAFDRLKEQYPVNSYVQSQCHPLTHVIGQAAIALYANVSEAYTKGDGFCWSGYYHGVMEGIVGKVGRENFPKMLNNFCSDIAGKASYSFDYFNCVHGLGHGVMAYSNDELFDSLDMCKTLNGSWEKTSCYGGAFMENVIIDNKNHFTKFLKKDDLLYPCNAVDSEYKGQCYMMQTSYALKENGGNFQATFELCEKADPGYEATCNQSLGRDASSRSYGNTTNLKNLCMLGKNTDQQTNCVIGAVKDVISYYHSDKQAAEFCGLLEANLKDICTSTAESYYKNF
jgi:hypothetical protein